MCGHIVVNFSWVKGYNMNNLYNTGGIFIINKPENKLNLILRSHLSNHLFRDNRVQTRSVKGLHFFAINGSRACTVAESRFA